MPAAKSKKLAYRVEYAVRAIVSVDVEANSYEDALKVANENRRKWALEGVTAEVFDANIRIIGVSETNGWSFLEEGS